MLRREFFSFASSAAIAAPQIVKHPEGRLAGLVSQIQQAVQSELLDVTKIEVTYDPDDPSVPLMIVAFRV